MSIIQRRLLIGISLFIVGAVAICSYFSYNHQYTRQHTEFITAASAPRPSVPAAAQHDAQRAETRQRYLPSELLNASSAVPASQLGSTVDGALTIDRDGRLVANHQLKNYFDYFLAAIGEQDLQQIRQRFEADIALRLDPHQRTAAQHWFERYLDYLSAAETLYPAPDLHDRLEQLATLRRDYLGDDLAEAFFGSEETYTRSVLLEQDILNDAQLSANEQQSLLEQVHRQLPPMLRESREQSTAHYAAVSQQRHYERHQIDTEHRFNERAERYGAEAAERLAALDRAREDWSSRVAEYRQQRAQLNAQNQASAEHLQALRELRTSLFDETEQRRIEALEALDFPGYEAHR